MMTVPETDSAATGYAPPAQLLPDHDEPIDAQVCALLDTGRDVITSGTLTATDDELAAACLRGGATLHHVGLHQFLVDLIVATMVQGPTSVSHIRIVEAFTGTVRPDDRRYRAGVETLGLAVFGAAPADIEVQIEHEPGADVDRLTVRGLLGGTEFYAGEVLASAGPPLDYGTDLPFGNYSGAVGYTVEIAGEPGDLVMQWEFDRYDEALLRKLAADAVPAVSAAEPGLLVADATPRYRPDDRLPD